PAALPAGSGVRAGRAGAGQRRPSRATEPTCSRSAAGGLCLLWRSLLLCSASSSWEGVRVMPEAVSAEAVAVALNTAWTLLAAFLVFFMQAGFALVEAGFTRAKNAAN